MSESRMEKVRKNVVTSILQNIFNVGISFLSRMIFVRILNESYLGINGLFSNILNILSLADLGMTTVMMYCLYRPIEEKNTDKISVLVAYFRKIYLWIAIIVLIAGLVLVPFLHLIVNLDHPVPFLHGYYILALLNVVISYLFVYRTTLIAADQKTYILNKYIMFFKFLTFLVQGLVLILFQNYFIYLVSALVISFISNICQNVAALKLYPFLKNKTINLETEEKHKIFEDIKAMFLYRISGVIQNNTDNIIISVLIGTVFVGFYSNYMLVVTQIATIISLVFNSVKASVGNLIVSNESDNEERFFLFQVCEMINFWIVGFCSVCFICLFQDFITIFFGSRYILNMNIVVAIVLNFYTNHIRQSIWMFRETTGLFQEIKYVTVVTAVLNIIFSLVFGYFWGMFGILLATTFARMVYAWWKEPVMLYQLYFKKNVKSYFISYFKNCFLCIGTCLITYFICHYITFSAKMFEFLLHILVCCILPNVIFFIFFVHTEEFHYILKHVDLSRRIE